VQWRTAVHANSVYNPSNQLSITKQPFPQGAKARICVGT
jgi:hypothetical protein